MIEIKKFVYFIIVLLFVWVVLWQCSSIIVVLRDSDGVKVSSTQIIDSINLKSGIKLKPSINLNNNDSINRTESSKNKKK